MPSNSPPQIGPMRALELLIEGNQRFTKGFRLLETFATRLGLEKLAREGQNPFCSVLTCADARIPVEAIFDRGFGDLFVTRVLGALVDEIVIATLEYGAKHLNIPLLIIMGHTRCSAIRLSRELNLQEVTGSAEPEHLYHLGNQIISSIDAARKRLSNNGRSTVWEEVFAEAQIESVRQRVSVIIETSEVIRTQINENKLLVIGALYDLDSGRVDFDLPDLEVRGTRNETREI